MKTENSYRGEHINMSFELFEEKGKDGRDLFDNIGELTSLLLLYQRISLYKKTTTFVDDIKLLIPLAITETIIEFDSSEKKISFIFSLLKNYKIEITRGQKNAPQKQTVVVTTAKALERFTHDELFEALVATVNYKRGSEEKNYILEGMMKAIRHEYGSIEEIIKEYIKISPDSFEEFILKLGFGKRDKSDMVNHG